MHSLDCLMSVAPSGCYSEFAAYQSPLIESNKLEPPFYITYSLPM